MKCSVESQTWETVMLRANVNVVEIFAFSFQCQKFDSYPSLSDHFYQAIVIFVELTLTVYVNFSLFAY